MTAESLKSFISLPSHSSQCSNNRYSNDNKIRFISFAVIVVLFCSAILGFEIWNSIRTTHLTNEVERLSNALEEMKHRFGLDYMEDLGNFENSYDHTDSEDDSFGTFEDMDDDDEFIYDDEEEGSADFGKDDEEDELDEDELDEYEHDENMYEDTKSKRHARSLTTSNGVPIVEDSYAVNRKRNDHDWNDSKALSAHNPPPSHHQNSFSKKYQQHRSTPTEYVPSPHDKTLNENSHQYTNQPTAQQEMISPSRYDIHVRRDRVMSTHEGKSKAFRRTISKTEYERLLRKGHIVDYENVNVGPKRTRGRGRSARQNRVKSIAIHYSGDTSKYVEGHHERYAGNGRFLHAGGVYTDWQASPWANILSMDRFFRLDNGILTILENGLYYIYAQIYYFDVHDTNGFVVQHNTQTFLQCVTGTPTVERVNKTNTCFTSGVSYLRNGETIRVSDSSKERYALFEPARSFFGLIKLGDARPLHETLN